MNVFRYAVQFSAGHRSTGSDVLAPLLVLAATVALGGMLITMLDSVVKPLRRTLHARRARKSRTRAWGTTEFRARAMMDQLCPEGWQAQIVLFGSADELPPDAPDPSRTRVALDWADFREPATIRSVWAETVSQALEVMVADRITDDTLLQIEQRALAEGLVWSDSY